MTRHPGSIELIAANAAQDLALANLLQLYIHDFSEFHAAETSEDGRFAYPDLHLYGTDPARHAFLIRVDGLLVGFVLVKPGRQALDGSPVRDIAEFFVLRGYRRRGIGMRSAHRLWEQLAGMWQVRVMHSNVAALRFWQAAIESYVGDEFAADRIEIDGARWTVFNFASPRA